MLSSGTTETTTEDYAKLSSNRPHRYYYFERNQASTATQPPHKLGVIRDQHLSHERSNELISSGSYTGFSGTGEYSCLQYPSMIYQ